MSTDNVNRAGPEASNVNLSLGTSAVEPLMFQSELSMGWSEAELEESAIDSHPGGSSAEAAESVGAVGAAVGGGSALVASAAMSAQKESNLKCRT